MDAVRHMPSNKNRSNAAALTAGKGIRNTPEGHRRRKITTLRHSTSVDITRDFPARRDFTPPHLLGKPISSIHTEDVQESKFRAFDPGGS